MFYNNKKTVYTIIIIIALLISFVIGKSLGNGNSTKKASGQNISVQNKNYNATLNITGVNYSLSYSVQGAYFIDKSTLNFSVNLQNSNNISSVKVIVKDQNNNLIDVKSNASNDANTLNYTVVLTDAIKKLNIVVYPLNKDMAGNTNLDLTTVPYQNTNLDLDLIKKSQIQSLQN